MGMDGYNSAEELTQLFTADEIGKGLTAITAEKIQMNFFYHFLLWMEGLYSREMMAN